MENNSTSIHGSPIIRIRSEKVFSNLTPAPGTIIKLPSGKTAIAHGSGLDKLRSDIKHPKSCKKSLSSQKLSTSLKKPTKSRRPPKYLTFTLAEILQTYESSLCSN